MMPMERRLEWNAPAGAGFAAPSSVQMSLPWLVRIALSLSFLAAFLQYEVSSGFALFLSLAFLALCGMLVLSGRQRADRLQHILSGGALWFAAMLFSEVISYTSGDFYSVAYGLVFIGVFLCARLTVLEIGVPNVVRAYSQAGILTVTLILISGRRTLFSNEGMRFAGGTRAHPNLVAFILVGFFPVLVWRALEEKGRRKKRILIGLSLAAFVFVFLTGSRGSLLAMLVSAGALLLRGMMAGWLQKVRLRHFHIIFILAVIPIALFSLIQHHRIERVGDYLNDSLALSSSQRGLKSGLSGRTGIWQIAFHILRTQDRWLFGFGYRAGDRMVGTIDNGYVQLLFESGAIAGSMILSSMLRVFFLLWKASRLRENNPWTRYYTMLWCLMIVYFLNNISTRYLFSFGSPFSLLILCLMAASRKELVGGGTSVQVGEKVMPPRAAPRALAWNRSVR